MDFEKFQKEVSRFVKREIEPSAFEIERESKFPKENFEKIAKKGWMGLNVPKKYGGFGGSLLHQAILYEELASVCGSTALSVLAHTSLGTACIVFFGTRAQKEKYLRDLAVGKKIAAFAFTEPGCGSDAKALSTRAIKKNGKYIINGSKMFCTNGGYADLIVIFAKTDPDKGSKGISGFIVEKGIKGLEIGKAEDKMGLRGSDTRQIHFDNLELKEEFLLGEIEGEGYKQALIVLQKARIGIAGYALGYARKSFESAISCGAENNLKDSQSFQFTISEMAQRIEATRQLIKWAGELEIKGKDYTYASSVAKVYASETSTFCVNGALKIMGFKGMVQDNFVEKIFRETKLTEIGEGASEVHKVIIAREILKNLKK